MTSLDSRTTRRADGQRSSMAGGLPGAASLSKAVSKTPRKYGQMLIAVVVVLAAVIAGGWLYMNKGGVEEVLVVDQPIPAGHPITEDDVRTSSDPLLVARSVSGIEGAILVSDVEEVYGKRTTVALLPGQVLTEDSLTDDLLPQEGKRLIAVNLPSGRVPDTLAPGSVVDAIAVPQEGQSGDPKALDEPPIISAGATVYSTNKSQDGTVVVTLLISETDARTVAAYGAVGQLTLLQAPITAGDPEDSAPQDDTATGGQD
ncbi:Flp pilus assembly protein CpaB [Nocardioides sp. BE266]|uniref:SAF domain-containing protein n=1 Tax=Nocardioides sp. BE266 TaxID=2817725 RepID=UPI0028574566|nr:SAF domain-containing protein [Nocardioides sp. BE266]MDR7254948.1 Flp pilus assembly protein CpaB [Nocardioides sp. BE266]